VGDVSGTARRHADLAGIGLRVGDELGNGLGRKCGLTTMMPAIRPMAATGAMSRMKLKLSLSYSVALIAFDVLASNSV